MLLSDLDYYFGGKVHHNNIKIVSMINSEQGALVRVQLANKTIGAKYLIFDAIDKLFNVKDYPLLDLEPIGRNVWFFNNFDQLISGKCQSATPFTYEVVSSMSLTTEGVFSPVGTMFYSTQVHIYS